MLRAGKIPVAADELREAAIGGAAVVNPFMAAHQADHNDRGFELQMSRIY